MPKHIWTKDELHLLEDNYQSMTLDQLSSLLNLSEKAIRLKLWRSGKKCIDKLIPKRVIVDNQYLIDNYLKYTNNELANHFNVGEATIARRLKDLNLSRAKEHNEKFFSVPNLLNSYWAGFIAADGTIGQAYNYDSYKFALILKETDINQLIQFKKDIQAYDSDLCFIKQAHTKTKKVSCKVGVYLTLTKEEIDDLAKWGIIKNKTLILEPPTLDLTYEQKLAYIKGYIDGDGSISKNGTCTVLGTKNLLSWIKNTLKITSIVTDYDTIYNLYINVSKLQNINNSIPYRGLERKWSRLK